jgi:hypothetical protein
MNRPSGLIYSNSKRVEVIDPNTMSAVDYFVNATSFCKHFGIDRNHSPNYLTKKHTRLKANGMMCQYEGDTYWANVKRKTRKVEVLDMVTLEVQMKFDSSLDFCNHFGVPHTSAFPYLGKRSKRSRLKGKFLARYEGDDYWERFFETQSASKQKDDILKKTQEVHRQEVKKLKEHIIRLNQMLVAKDMEIQKLKEDARNEPRTDFLNDTDLTVSHVSRVVCKYYGCPESYITSSSRESTAMWPRHLYSWMLYKRVVPNGNSLTAIGTMTGGRTHASVINSIKKVNNRIETDSEFREGIETILSIYGFKVRLDKRRAELIRI